MTRRTKTTVTRLAASLGLAVGLAVLGGSPAGAAADAPTVVPDAAAEALPPEVGGSATSDPSKPTSELAPYDTGTNKLLCQAGQASSFFYAVHIEHSGNDETTLPGVVLSIDLPAGVSYLEPYPGFSGPDTAQPQTAGTLDWNIGDLSVEAANVVFKAQLASCPADGTTLAATVRGETSDDRTDTSSIAFGVATTGQSNPGPVTNPGPSSNDATPAAVVPAAAPADQAPSVLGTQQSQAGTLAFTGSGRAWLAPLGALGAVCIGVGIVLVRRFRTD